LVPPHALQDNLCTLGLQTTAGSQQLAGYVPPYDATAVARLRAAGAVLLGKTNMDEVRLFCGHKCVATLMRKAAKH
jgi:Asp-tRNA(Asn)/Glu-tRNA(Gln) amidotransferase A subunit family amidase